MGRKVIQIKRKKSIRAFLTVEVYFKYFLRNRDDDKADKTL